MADKANVNNVPMQGKGAYSSHAALQHEAMLKALPLFQRAAATANSKPDDACTTIIEYGSAHGNNSLEPLKAILQATPPGAVELLFSDRFENDFNTLSETITTWADELDTLKFSHHLYMSMIPRSFYREVIPPKSAHLGFSLAALHHLDHVPKPASEQSNDTQLRRQQAHVDLCTFLDLRAHEIVPGGSLVLSFVSQSPAGWENYSGPVDACRNALVQMVQDGRIPLSVAGAFHVPTYNRTLDDVKEVLEETAKAWTVNDMFEDEVLHPALHDLRSAPVERQEEASRKYADTVVDWMMAVCSGYFTKAVKVGAQGAYTQDQEEELLQDWVSRTKKFFLRDHKDEEVRCSFIYLWLERV